MQLDDALISRVVADHPLPVADAMAALCAADSAHERRDRVVECFRAALRYLAAVALAVRVQYGAGPGDEPAQLRDMMHSLRRRGLTDGQWVGMIRGLMGSWAGEPDAYPVPGLASLFVGKSKKKLAKLLDGLLEMRKAETVAHGATGSADAIKKVLERREPQLAALLTTLSPLLVDLQLVVPVDKMTVLSLMGDTPGRGKWKRRALALSGVEAGQPLLVDADGKPRVSLHPVALFLEPSPDAERELFFLDGAKRKAALYVAFPSMAEHRAVEVWGVLGDSLLAGDAEEEAPPSTKGVARPYRGLMSFGPEHAALFFGREKQAEALANRIRRHPLLTLTGPSGSGKSSLLHAGVFPLLDDVTVLSFRPGAQPFKALCRALQARAADAPIVLFIDQCEEVFTLCHDHEERQAFAEAVAAEGSDPDGPTRVVLSLREDYFSRLATLSPLRNIYARHVEVVTAPDHDDLIRIVYAPAAMFGFSFEEESIVEEMVAAVRGEPAALAMLQFCADRLWDRRDRKWKRLTRDAYRAIGGVEGALAEHAEAVLSELTPSHRTTARAMFLALVTEEHTRAVVAKVDLLASCGDEDEAAQVLDKLVDARLLTVREAEDGAQDSIELVHEALLRHWERLRGWISEDEAFVRVRARVAAAATRWERDDRTGDLLLGEGKPLLEAAELLETRRDALRPVDVAFVEASQAKGRRLTRIKRAAVVALALLSVLAAGFGALSYVERNRAEANAAEALARAISITIEQGRQELHAGRPLRALAYLSDAYSRGGDGVALRTLMAGATKGADARVMDLAGHGQAWVRFVRFTGDRILSLDAGGVLKSWRKSDGELMHEVQTHASGISAVETFTGVIATGDKDGNIRMWSPDGTAMSRWDGAHDGEVIDLAFDDGGARLASASSDKTVKLWSVSSGAVPEHVFDVRAQCVAIHPDGDLIGLCSGKQAELRRVDEEPLVLSHDKTVDGVSFDRSGERALTFASKRAYLWNMQGERVAELKGHTAFIRSAYFLPQSDKVVTAAADNTGRIFDAVTGKQLTVFGGHSDFARPGAFTPASMALAVMAPGRTHLASRGSDHSVRIWDAVSGHGLALLEGHRHQVSALAFDGAGKHIVTASAKGELILWRNTRGHLRRSVTNKKKITAAAMFGEALITIADRKASLERRELAIASALAVDNDRFATVDGKAVTIYGERGPIKSFDAPGAQRLAWVPATDGMAKRLIAGNTLFDVGSGEPLRTFDGHKKPIMWLAVGGDGKTVATVERGVAKIWSLDGDAPLFTTPEPKDAWRMQPMAELSPDGSRICIMTSSLKASIWSIADREEVLSLDGAFATFSPDGRELVVLEDLSPTVRIYDATSGELRATLDGHEKTVTWARYFPGGSRILTTADDGTARIWLADSGNLLQTLTAHRGPIDHADLIGDTVLTVGDGTAKLWSIALEERGPEDIAALAERTSPWSLAGGRLVPKLAPKSAP